MPKEHVDLGDSASSKKKGEKAARVRNKSCLECRKRKLRCDAVHPVCSTCLRSYNHILQHLPADQEPPPYPHCTFEEGYDFSAPFVRPSGSRRGKVAILESRIGELESMLKSSGVGDVEDSQSSGFGAEESARSGKSGGPKDASFLSSTTAWRTSSDGNTITPNHQSTGSGSFDQQAQEPGFNAYSSSDSNPNFRRNASNASPSFGTSRTGSSLAPASLTPSNGQQWYSLPSSSTSSFASAPNPAPFASNPIPPFYASIPTAASGPWAYPSIPPAGPAPARQPAFDTFPPNAPFLPSQAPTAAAHFDSPEELVESPSQHWLPNLSGNQHHPQRQSSAATVEDVEEETPSWFGGGAGSVDPQQQNGTDASPGVSDNSFLMSLLWPGWPPYLPSPGKLEHIVKVFFSVVPFATELLNEARFLARLSLPPTHNLFPHPALLHAICAATSRYLADIQLVSSESVFHPITFTAKRTDFESEAVPTWSGEGPKPLTTRRLVDEDFGEVHHRWGTLYVDRGKTNAGEWLQLVQALFLLAQYAHQHALWVQGWLHMSLMGRFVIPLGLNARPFYARNDPHFTRDLLLPPSDDPVDRLERANVFWLVLCQDTYSSTASGWEGIMNGHDLFLGLPTVHATYAGEENPALPTQFGDDDDIFSRHTPEQTAFTLDVKGTLLLQKVARYVRRAEMRGDGDPRATESFRALDKLITSYRASFPQEFRDPLRCVTSGGKAVDRNLVVAHTLPFVAVITLHDPYCDFHDPDDSSSLRMLAAARALLGILYLINSTNFSFALLHPFMSYAWFLGARTLAKHVQVAVANGDFPLEASLREEIRVMRHAIKSVASTLPIGARQAEILDQILLDLRIDPTNKRVFPTHNHGLIFSHLSIPGATITSTSSPASNPPPPTGTTPQATTSSGWTPPPSSSAGWWQPQAGGGEQASDTAAWGSSWGGVGGTTEGAEGGQAVERLMAEMEEMQVPWEARPFFAS